MDTNYTDFPAQQSADTFDPNTAYVVPQGHGLLSPPQHCLEEQSSQSQHKTDYFPVANDNSNTSTFTPLHRPTPHTTSNALASTPHTTSTERTFYRRQPNGQLLRNSDPSTSDSMLDVSGGIWTWPASPSLTVRGTIAIEVNIEFVDHGLDDAREGGERGGRLRRVFEERTLEVLQRYVEEERGEWRVLWV